MVQFNLLEKESFSIYLSFLLRISFVGHTDRTAAGPLLDPIAALAACNFNATTANSVDDAFFSYLD
jgi:hypothetical protein